MKNWIDRVFGWICPIHKRPTDNGKCLECNNEMG